MEENYIDTGVTYR